MDEGEKEKIEYHPLYPGAQKERLTAYQIELESAFVKIEFLFAECDIQEVFAVVNTIRRLTKLYGLPIGELVRNRMQDILYDLSSFQQRTTITKELVEEYKGKIEQVVAAYEITIQRIAPKGFGANATDFIENCIWHRFHRFNPSEVTILQLHTYIVETISRSAHLLRAVFGKEYSNLLDAEDHPIDSDILFTSPAADEELIEREDTDEITKIYLKILKGLERYEDRVIFAALYNRLPRNLIPGSDDEIRSVQEKAAILYSKIDELSEFENESGFSENDYIQKEIPSQSEYQKNNPLREAEIWKKIQTIARSVSLSQFFFLVEKLSTRARQVLLFYIGYFYQHKHIYEFTDNILLGSKETEPLDEFRFAAEELQTVFQKAPTPIPNSESSILQVATNPLLEKINFATEGKRVYHGSPRAYLIERLTPLSVPERERLLLPLSPMGRNIILDSVIPSAETGKLPTRNMLANKYRTTWYWVQQLFLIAKTRIEEYDLRFCLTGEQGMDLVLSDSKHGRLLNYQLPPDSQLKNYISTRDIEIIRCVKQRNENGFFRSVSETASFLGITESSVRTYISSIMTKLETAKLPDLEPLRMESLPTLFREINSVRKAMIVAIILKDAENFAIEHQGDGIEWPGMPYKNLHDEVVARLGLQDEKIYNELLKPRGPRLYMLVSRGFGTIVTRRNGNFYINPEVRAQTRAYTNCLLDDIDIQGNSQLEAVLPEGTEISGKIAAKESLPLKVAVCWDLASSFLDFNGYPNHKSIGKLSFVNSYNKNYGITRSTLDGILAILERLSLLYQQQIHKYNYITVDETNNLSLLFKLRSILDASSTINGFRQMRLSGCFSDTFLRGENIELSRNAWKSSLEKGHRIDKKTGEPIQIMQHKVEEELGEKGSLSIYQLALAIDKSRSYAVRVLEQMRNQGMIIIDKPSGPRVPLSYRLATPDERTTFTLHSEIAAGFGQMKYGEDRTGEIFRTFDSEIAGYFAGIQDREQLQNAIRVFHTFFLALRQELLTEQINSVEIAIQQLDRRNTIEYARYTQLLNGLQMEFQTNEASLQSRQGLGEEDTTGAGYMEVYVFLMTRYSHLREALKTEASNARIGTIEASKHLEEINKVLPHIGI